MCTFAVQFRNEEANILGYGVMVTLQILVLSFLVRVRVSQLSSGCIASIHPVFLCPESLSGRARTGETGAVEAWWRGSRNSVGIGK